MKESNIKVMIVDDHEIFRLGLSMLLTEADDIHVVAEARNGEMALEYCATLQPDVVLMDIKMPGMSGIETTKHIMERFPQTRVVVLTSFEEDNYVSDILEAGALSFLMKGTTADKLIEAVRGANLGEGTLSSNATAALIRSLKQPALPLEPITDRENDVLRELTQGKNNREIGEALFISVSTVKNHVSSILQKLDASSRSEAVALALRHNLVPMD